MYKLYKGNVKIIGNKLEISKNYEYYICSEGKVFIIKRPSFMGKIMARKKHLTIAQENVTSLDTLKKYKKMLKEIYNYRCVIQEAMLNGENLDEINLQSKEYKKH